MNKFTRIMSPIAVTMTISSALVVGPVLAPAAFADGKATLGCSSPYQLATITQIDAFSQPLVTEGYFTEASLLALLNSLDHNGDGSLCYKVPSGWFGPSATNGAQKAGFVNLVDDKVITS